MSELFRKFQMMCTVALGSFPVVVLLFAYTQQSFLSFAWLYPILFLIFSMIGILIGKKFRLLYGIAVTVAVFLSAFVFSNGNPAFPLLIVGAIFAALFLWSISMAGWPPNWELPVALRFVCFGIHLVAQYAVLADRIETQPVLTEHATSLYFAFVGYLFLVLLSMNRDSMNKASTEARRVPVTMRKKNVIMTLVLLGLAFAASFLPYIYDWMKAFAGWFVGFLITLMSRQQAEETPVATSAPPTEATEQMLPVEEVLIKEMSPIFEFIILTFGGLIMVGVLVFLVYWLIKRLISLTSKLLGALERYAASVAEDYEDEITDTRKEAAGEQIAKKRRLAKHMAVNQRSLSPGERIRYRYRSLLRRHPEWTADRTARENMPFDMAKLYEKSRYSDHAVSEAEAAQFQTGSKVL